MEWLSSGNHAAALALAAQIRGIPAHIVVPRNAPACKIANVERYGGKVVTCEPNIQSREETAQRVQESTGAVLVLPFNDGRVMRYLGHLLDFTLEFSSLSFYFT